MVVDVSPLAAVLRGRRLAVLTGAGCSTESGIPDYRGPGRATRTRDPIQYRAFMRDPEARRRYWAGSMAGWPRVAAARPNPAHATLAAMERDGVVTGVITQNVDRLHQAAGSRRVVELHGALARVVCQQCGVGESRASVQARLAATNRDWTGEAALAPDGDAVPSRSLDGFAVPECAACGGLLKPDVVFFGEGVPRDRVDRAWGMLAASDALLVIGSSLTVFSGYRFVRGAVRDGKSVAIVNLGPTRGDPLATVRLEGRAGEALPALAAALRP